MVASTMCHNKRKPTNAESVGEPRDLANAFSVGTHGFVGFPRVLASSNPGLKLANAFGVPTGSFRLNQYLVFGRRRSAPCLNEIASGIERGMS